MSVPQVYTFDIKPDPDTLDVKPGYVHVPNLGRFSTKDCAGKPLPMGDLLRAHGASLSGRFARANDMTIVKVMNSRTVRLKVSWPGYADWITDINAGPIGSMATQVATVFKTFLANSSGHRKAGVLSDWNIQTKRFTLEDFALVAIVHLGEDLFTAEIEQVQCRPGSPRGRF
ncbi:hypothetical protein L227DRAFT_617131 [Lentinus tigrinus ALCF2SS1-6]|uniref:Uncharacterized protein n=1 Tax=Lentinus tigrinus ALCF2SS1-6 TaxID=1328759 RepID=A0A5C2RQ84_9APHY|nr:hypothetical protein L227DRAFT_617131 [Lentinus tigrinus ALCF2SS1-6]